MLNSISERMSRYLVRINVVNEENVEVYTYGFMLIFSTAFSVLTVLIIAALFGNLFFGILFLAVMMFLRFFCGGYHCSTYFNCWLCTNSIAACVFFSIKLLPLKNLTVNLFVLCFGVAAAIYIYINSPIENLNNPLNDRKRLKNRRISRVLTVIFVSVLFVGFIFFRYSASFSYFTAISAALVVVAVLMITEKVNWR